MNTLRQPYNELSPEVYNALVQAKIALEKSELDGALIELVYLRVSQINGCAFCLEMHSKALRKSGVAQNKLDALAGWRGRNRSPISPKAMRKTMFICRCWTILAPARLAI